MGIERPSSSSYCCSVGNIRTGLEEQKIMNSFALVVNHYVRTLDNQTVSLSFWVVVLYCLSVEL